MISKITIEGSLQQDSLNGKSAFNIAVEEAKEHINILSFNIEGKRDPFELKFYYEYKVTGTPKE